MTVVTLRQQRSVGKILARPWFCVCFSHAKIKWWRNQPKKKSFKRLYHRVLSSNMIWQIYLVGSAEIFLDTEGLSYMAHCPSEEWSSGLLPSGCAGSTLHVCLDEGRVRADIQPAPLLHSHVFRLVMELPLSGTEVGPLGSTQSSLHLVFHKGWFYFFYFLCLLSNSLGRNAFIF